MNPLYNSLEEKLIQNGILPPAGIENTQSSAENFFEKTPPEKTGEKSPDESGNFFKEVPDNTPFRKNSAKRLNDYDLDLIENPIGSSKTKNVETSAQVLKRFLNFKQNKLENGSANFREALFARFFPRLYKARLIKEAMAKFLELNIDTQTLLDKTIPYGENEMRYGDLVKFLNYANELQTRLKKKI